MHDSHDERDRDDQADQDVSERVWLQRRGNRYRTNV